MRLLNVDTLKLESFVEGVPEYAILSHTWGRDEVLFQDVQEGTGNRKSGWIKIEKCCNIVAQNGFRYVWIDTCCIDKRDSVELSEAINSMFKWYEQSAVCYAYLSDLFGGPDDWAHCRWWSRGWTLQELLAPRFMVFFDASWNSHGTKELLAPRIATLTGIAVEHLKDFRSCDIATKMSWAAGRTTTRVEDQAYCLLGLFGITMPLVYGEGRGAFIRLQHELIKQFDDESIFAHGYASPSSNLLATLPGAFTLGTRRVIDPLRPDYAITNKGLLIEPIVYTHNVASANLLVPLNYGPISGGHYVLELEPRYSGEGAEVYQKFNLIEMYEISPESPFIRGGRRKIYVSLVADDSPVSSFTQRDCIVAFDLEEGISHGPVTSLTSAFGARKVSDEYYELPGRSDALLMLNGVYGLKMEIGVRVGDQNGTLMVAVIRNGTSFVANVFHPSWFPKLTWPLSDAKLSVFMTDPNLTTSLLRYGKTVIWVELHPKGQARDQWLSRFGFRAFSVKVRIRHDPEWDDPIGDIRKGERTVQAERMSPILRPGAIPR